MLTKMRASKKGTNTKPFGGLLRPRVSTRTRTSPRELEISTSSPRRKPRACASSWCIKHSASGTALYSSGTRRVIVPVCQCSRTRPVQSHKSYSSLGISGGAS
ncbi:Uncharacterised protein [Vibrio cholerae]|nr:Uncharacterised protein [Vibrio cholerae]CSB46831.1 Uncharacterised protein [Vibrio cholerae]